MGFLTKLLRRITGRGKGKAGAQKDGGGGLQQAIGNRLTAKAILEQQLVPKAWPQGAPGTRVQLTNRHGGESEVGGDANLDRVWGKKTHYARTEEEQARYLMSTAKAPDGRTLLTGNDGKLLDTAKSTMPVGMSRTEGRNIFVMGADGKMRSLDVGSEYRRINPQAGDDDRFIPDDVERVHHTTMLGGQDVLAAGEMEIDQGQLRMMSNRSGHYLPPAAALHQAVSQLDRAGVEMGAVGMQVLGSGGEFERMHDKGMLSIPALQFLAHGKEMEDARQRASKPELSSFQRTQILNEPLEGIRADRARNAGFFAAAAAEARRRGLGDPDNPSEEKDPEPPVTAPATPSPSTSDTSSDAIVYNNPGSLRSTGPSPASDSFYNLEEKDDDPVSAPAPVPNPTSASVGEDERSDGEPVSEEDAAELAEEVKQLYGVSPL